MIKKENKVSLPVGKTATVLFILTWLGIIVLFSGGVMFGFELFDAIGQALSSLSEHLSSMIGNIGQALPTEGFTVQM